MTTTAPVTEASIAHPTGSASQRLGWAISPAGTFAACKIPTPTGIVVEIAEPFTGRLRRTIAIDGLGLDSELTIADDGALTAATRTPERLRVRTWPVAAPPYDWRTCLPASTRVLPAADGRLYGISPGAGGSRLTHLTPDGQTELGHPGQAVLDVRRLSSTTLVCTVVGNSNYTRAVQYDPVTGAVTDFVNTTDAADDRVVAITDDTVVVTTTAAGEPRLGWGSLRRGRLRFPAAGASDRAVRLLGLSPDGRRALIWQDRGMLLRLAELDLVTDTAQELATVAGQVAGAARLCAGRWRFPMSDLSHGTTMVELDHTGSVRHDQGPISDEPPGAVIAVPGPAGPIESLVLGDPATADRVVIALHGGPLAAWRATHHPLFAELVADGAAVVAPNIRGSIGYGRDHAYAIRDAWGGPDRDDVLAVAGWVASRRPTHVTPPVVLGESYGAYLAVLCAATAPPGTWSGCVAMATFTSGQRIQDLGTGVSALVRRLGGATSPDLLELAGDLTVPALLLHGDLDDTVPVTESITLAAAIRTAGGTVQLVRDPDGDHDLLCSAAAPAHRRRIRDTVQTAGQPCRPATNWERR